MIAMVVTNHMLRKKMAQVNQAVRTYNPIMNNTQSSIPDEETGIQISTEKITAIQSDTVITDKGSKAKLFNPIPCLHWKCMNTPDASGVMQLRNSLEGLFIDDGVNKYCIGVSGTSEEFEIRLQVGTNEVRLNNLFLNISTSHFVLNGLEENTNE